MQCHQMLQLPARCIRSNAPFPLRAVQCRCGLPGTLFSPVLSLGLCVSTFVLPLAAVGKDPGHGAAQLATTLSQDPCLACATSPLPPPVRILPLRPG